MEKRECLCASFSCQHYLSDLRPKLQDSGHSSTLRPHFPVEFWSVCVCANVDLLVVLQDKRTLQAALSVTNCVQAAVTISGNTQLRLCHNLSLSSCLQIQSQDLKALHLLGSICRNYKCMFLVIKSQTHIFLTYCIT